MMAGAAILTIASFFMAVAPNWQILVVGRALDGVAIGRTVSHCDPDDTRCFEKFFIFENVIKNINKALQKFSK